jgi:hypothetical protein
VTIEISLYLFGFTRPNPVIARPVRDIARCFVIDTRTHTHVKEDCNKLEANQCVDERREIRK